VHTGATEQTASRGSALPDAVSDSIFEAAGGEAVLGGLSPSERAAYLVDRHNWHPAVAVKVSERFSSAEQARIALREVWEEGASPAAGSLLELYDDAVRKFKHNAFLGYWIMDTLYPLGAWKTISYVQVRLLIDDIRQLLSNLGIVEGSRVALISRNSVEWFALAMATFGLRATLVALPEEMSEADWLDALADAQPHIVWCGGKVTYQRVYDAVEKSGRKDLILATDSWLADKVLGFRHPIMCIDGIDGYERWQEHALTHRCAPGPEQQPHAASARAACGLPRGGFLTLNPLPFSRRGAVLSLT